MWYKKKIGCELYSNVHPSKAVLFVRQLAFLQLGHYNKIGVMFCQDGVRTEEGEI